MPLGRRHDWCPPTREQTLLLVEAAKVCLHEVETMRKDWDTQARQPDGSIPVASDRDELERLDAVIALTRDAVADVAGDQP
jgi:hypothetical protein